MIQRSGFRRSTKLDWLDYRASADQPDNDKVGCGYTFLTEIDSFDESIKAQARADGGQKIGPLAIPRASLPRVSPD